MLSDSVRLVAAEGESPEALRERARAILEQGDYQTELPPSQPDEPWHESGKTPEWVGWLVGGAALVFIAIVVVRLIGDRLKRSRLPARAPTERALGKRDVATPVAMTAGVASPGDPSTLAADGRHEEAIHALLLQVFRSMFEALQRAPPVGRTAREIVRALPSAGVEPLAGLVALVERGRFAVQPVGVAEWEEAQRLKAALPAGVAR